MPQMQLKIILTGLLFTLLSVSPNQAQTIEYSQPVARYLVDLGSFIRNSYNKEFSFKGVVLNQSGANNPVMLNLTGKIVSLSKLDRKTHQFQVMKRLSDFKNARVVYLPKVKISKKESVAIYAIPIPTNAIKLFKNIESIAGITTIIIPVFDNVSTNNPTTGCIKFPTKNRGYRRVVLLF